MYTPTIGLEIHAELKTKTKMFCDSPNDPNEVAPNVNVCPVCFSHPGSLPVINFEAVKSVLKVGTALGSHLADYTEFDRKNYFYPDLPKGYQLSQYEYPLVSGGSLAGIALTRIHLEEDTASSIHNELSGETLVDYNRAGVPLMELVTEPVIHSAEDAGKFARELQLLLRYLGVSDANMEKGEMRVEANVSVGKDGVLGTKVEIKNLNSFKAMERAVAYEIIRQTKLLEAGGTVVQQTLGWDEGKQATFAQRTKEGSADYRYFPDPDLPSLKLSEIPGLREVDIKSTLPELPHERRQRYAAVGLKSEDVELYVGEPVFGDFFDAVVSVSSMSSGQTILASNYISNDLVKIVRDSAKRDTIDNDDIHISVENFNKIIELLSSKKISSRSGKDLLLQSFTTGEDPEVIAKRENLFHSDTDLLPIVQKILADNPSVVAEVKGGKLAALEFLVGQGMKALRGAADPAQLRSTIQGLIH